MMQANRKCLPVRTRLLSLVAVVLAAGVVAPQLKGVHGWTIPLPRSSFSAIIIGTSSTRGRGQPQQQGQIRTCRARLQLAANDDDDGDSSTTATATIDAAAAAVDEDLPTVDVVGAKFFGGNREKEEFYDAEAEATAGTISGSGDMAATAATSASSYDRFADRTAFEDELSAGMAKDVQRLINSALLSGVGGNGKANTNKDLKYSYAADVQWETPFPNSVAASAFASASPTSGTGTGAVLEALAEASDFYSRIDVAVTGGRQLSDAQVELRWEISVVWPTFWEPRVLLTGASRLTLGGGGNSNSIAQQIDTLDAGSNNLVSTITGQLLPRFWDVYHIGMTPSAELSPKLPPSQKTGSGLFSSYTVTDLPPRLYWQPALVDTGTRTDQNAAMLPNRAFACNAIKTMGPTKDRYVPTMPTQVQINPVQQNDSGGSSSGNSNNKQLLLQWLIPVSVEFLAANDKLPLPGPDSEDDEALSADADRPEFTYVWQPRRRVATLPYGGSPQDPEISAIRQKLYEQVARDGLKPKLDGNNKPMFFFWQNGVKACYTREGGLGMAVYEWRPKLVETNEVGIELEV